MSLEHHSTGRREGEIAIRVDDRDDAADFHFTMDAVMVFILFELSVFILCFCTRVYICRRVMVRGMHMLVP